MERHYRSSRFFSQPVLFFLLFWGGGKVCQKPEDTYLKASDKKVWTFWPKGNYSRRFSRGCYWFLSSFPLLLMLPFSHALAISMQECGYWLQEHNYTTWGAELQSHKQNQMQIYTYSQKCTYSKQVNYCSFARMQISSLSTVHAPFLKKRLSNVIRKWE